MNRIITWGVVSLIAIGILYVISVTLTPFVIAFIFSYLLQPVIEANCRIFKLPRGIVTFAVFSLFLSGFIAIIVLIIPIIYQQLSVFINKIPHYKSNIESGVTSLLETLNDVDPELASKVSDAAHSFVNSAFTVFASFANHIWQYTIATINFFAIIALVPIILYYFLRDWPKMVKSVEAILPIRGKSKVREIVASINELLSAYIRGQLNICLILSIYYIIGLSVLGLDLAFLLGILSGFLIIIPFIGTIISFSLVALSCYITFGAGIELVYVVILYVLGNAVESGILSPKIIGNRIGLHPVWIIFSVFAMGSLFGIIGIIFAIPIAGIVKVLLTQILDYYKSSQMYKN